jgi:hypothetical protein
MRNVVAMLTAYALLAGCGSGGSGDGLAAAQLAHALTPLTLDAIPDLTNSADTASTRYVLAVHNSTGTAQVVSVVSTNPVIARVEGSNAPLSVILTPLSVGTVQVTVTVADDSSSARQTFNYTVANRTRTFQLSAADTGQDAIELTNNSNTHQLIGLVHNGFPTFATRQDIVDYVRAMPDEMSGEPFARKLWRFLITTTYHWPQFGTQIYLDDPLLVVNSLGFGFCGQVASSYVLIAREAGYEARVWGLSGHVVSEILVDGKWQMYDSDLYVYYLDRQGEVAGVEELAADPTLITQPITPIWPQYLDSVLYSASLAQIYSSTQDNFLGTGFEPTAASPSGLIDLPPHGVLTYPGHWTDAPIGYDGTVPYPVPYFRQARLDIPSDFSGAISLPWMAWDIQGSGYVLIDGTLYTVGSAELSTLLQHGPKLIHQIEVLGSSTGLGIVFLVNVYNYAMADQNSVAVSGLGVAAIGAQVVQLPSQFQQPPTITGSKPVP